MAKKSKVETVEKVLVAEKAVVEVETKEETTVQVSTEPYSTGDLSKAELYQSVGGTLVAITSSESGKMYHFVESASELENKVDTANKSDK